MLVRSKHIVASQFTGLSGNPGSNPLPWLCPSPSPSPMRTSTMCGPAEYSKRQGHTSLALSSCFLAKGSHLTFFL